MGTSAVLTVTAHLGGRQSPQASKVSEARSREEREGGQGTAGNLLRKLKADTQMSKTKGSRLSVNGHKQPRRRGGCELWVLWDGTCSHLQSCRSEQHFIKQYHSSDRGPAPGSEPFPRRERSPWV